MPVIIRHGQFPNHPNFGCVTGYRTVADGYVSNDGFPRGSYSGLTTSVIACALGVEAITGTLTQYATGAYYVTNTRNASGNLTSLIEASARTLAPTYTPLDTLFPANTTNTSRPPIGSYTPSIGEKILDSRIRFNSTSSRFGSNPHTVVTYMDELPLLYGFETVLYHSPRCFRASKSYNIINGVISSLNIGTFESLISNKHVKDVPPTPLTIDVPFMFLSSGPFGSLATTGSGVCTPATNPVVYKMLNRQESEAYYKQGGTPSYDADDFDALTSPTLQQAIAAGGCQYFGIMKHVKPNAYTVTTSSLLTGYAAGGPPYHPYSEGTANIDYKNYSNRDTVETDATVSDGVFGGGGTGTRTVVKSGFYHIPWYSATPTYAPPNNTLQPQYAIVLSP